MNSGAAFVISQSDGGTDQCILVQEAGRAARRKPNYAAAVSAIRGAVLQEFDLMLNQVVLTAPGSMPKTWSGKIRRSETRAQFLTNTLTYINK